MIANLSMPRAIAGTALTLVLGAFDVLAQPEGSQGKPRVTGAVGRWIDTVHEGEPVIRGEGVVDAVLPAEASSAAVAIFGQPHPAFVANATAAAAFALAVLPHPPLAAGAFSAQFNLVSGVSDQTAGLVFGLQPTGEYYFVRYNTREGNVALWRYADGKREVVARTSDKVQLALGNWHRIRLTIDNTRIIGQVNDTMRLEHDLGRAPSGRVGFWTKRDSVTMFKQISVEPR